MAGGAEIKIRINSITETKKVTDAMYMISSVKMQKARREMENTYPYFRAIREEIGELLHYVPENDDRYFRNLDPDGIQGRALLLITSDKGLSGSYNQLAIRAAEEKIRLFPDTLIFPVGEYGRQYMLQKRHPVAENFSCTAAFPTLTAARKLCTELLDYYNSDRVDEIDIIYTHYHAGRPGNCRFLTLLPLDQSSFYDSSEPVYGKEYFPDPNTVLDGIVPGYLTGFIYSALVDSYCSEQEARMTAMNTAGKNAEDMLKKLRIQYNGIRQAAITREMTEISSGAKALKRKREQAMKRRAQAEMQK